MTITNQENDGSTDLSSKIYFFDRLLKTESFGWLILAVLVNGLLIFYTTNFTLRTFPMIPDEYTYLTTAKLFAVGKLSVPSPQPKEFFDTLNFVNNGSYYGKYPPGWPAMLAIGIRTGLEWFVNPVLGILTLVIIFVFARTLFSSTVANITMALTLACPFFIFNSACLMSHTSSLLLLTLAAYFLFCSDKTYMPSFGFGMAAGFAFLIRPFTALLVLAPQVIYFSVQSIRQNNSRVLRNLLLGAFPVLILFAALFLFYNYVQTGNPFLQPFNLYNPFERLGFFQHTWKEYSDRLNQNVFERTLDLIKWTSGVPLLIFLILTIKKKSDPAIRLSLLFLAPALCLLVGYFFYAGSGKYQYGPRYLYESYALLLIPASIGVLAIKRLVPLLLVTVLFLNTFNFIQKSFYYHREIGERIHFFDLTNHLSNSVVFIRAVDPTASRYFTRNGLDFNDSVLLLLDLGPENNKEIIRRYPNRSFYICTFDTHDWNKLLKPYETSSE